MNTTTITRVQALAMLAYVAKSGDLEKFTADQLAEAGAVVERMAKQIAAQQAKPKKSRANAANIEAIQEFANVHPDFAGTVSDFMEVYPLALTPQKATALLTCGVKSGVLEVHAPEKKSGVNTYSVI